MGRLQGEFVEYLVQIFATESPINGLYAIARTQVEGPERGIADKSLINVNRVLDEVAMDWGGSRPSVLEGLKSLTSTPYCQHCCHTVFGQRGP